jgi:anaerobic magnesium-protoporphyrin IX monomethyl ester cyclase
MKSILLAIPEKHSLDALYPPVGLLYLAAVARNNGHEVRVMDGQIVGNETILKEFGQRKYDYFGTTILSPLREDSYALIRKTKQIRPECIVIAGGVHVSILPKQTMHHVPEIDIAVIGEGEETLSDILSGKPLPDIYGIWYRNGDGVYKTQPRKSLEVNCISIPAWDLIDIKAYRSFEEIVVDGEKLGSMLTVYSSRGCTGKCSFCSTWWIWKRWRQFSADRFVDEIEQLYRRGINHFFFADDSMINNEEFIEFFYDEIRRRKLKIHFKISCRVDKINYHVANIMRKAGCYEAHVGFESGSQRILDAMGKGITVEQNIRAAESLHRAGIRVYALMVIGHIDEDVNSINETIDFLNEIRPTVVASMNGLMLLPGTKDYQRCKKESFIADDFWLGDEPFKIYTGTFSLQELMLIRKMINHRFKIWSRRWLHIQAILYIPNDYLSAFRLWFPFRQTLRLYDIFRKVFRRFITIW